MLLDEVNIYTKYKLLKTMKFDPDNLSSDDELPFHTGLGFKKTK